MTFRRDPDDRIAAWAADAAGGGGPDYLPEVLLMVERTPQHRWARWVPAAWKVSPAKAPSMGTRAVLVIAAALLLVLLVASVLVAGAFRRPAFRLQAVVPVPGSVGVPFVSATDDALWATTEGGVVAIDPATGVATRFDLPDGGTELTGVVATGDAIWVADYHGNAVVRLDRTTGLVVDTITVANPTNLQVQDDTVWVQDAGGDGAVRIDPTTSEIDFRLPEASSFAVVPGALWYVARSEFGPSATEAFAVEVDPATGVERRRIPVPVAAARAITIDAAGNPWVYQRQSDRSTIVAVDAERGTTETPFVVPYDVIGGILPIGSSMWALTAVASPGGARIVELGPTGPTGRAEALDDGLDPDVPVVAFGSIWIPWDSHAKLYRYPVDALAP